MNSYIINKQYIDSMETALLDTRNGRLYWDAIIKKHLHDCFVDNFTDFSDSTCFTYFIACDNCRFPLGSQYLMNFLNAGTCAYYIKVQISIRTPILCVLLCKYDGSPTALQTCEEPYTKSQQCTYSAILQFAKENGLEIAKYSELTQRVVSTLPKKQTAYSFFFEPDEMD